MKDDLKKMSIKELYGVCYQEMMVGETGYSMKLLTEEFKRRKLPKPIPIKMAPKMLLIKDIEVPTKPMSGIIAPDGSKTQSNLDLYHNHPNQGIVVAMASDIEWKDLYLGAKVALNNPGMVNVYKHEGVKYAFVGYSIIIGIL